METGRTKTTEYDMDAADRLTDIQAVATVCIVRPLPKADLYTLAWHCNPTPSLRREFTVTDWGLYSDQIDEGLSLLKELGYISLSPVRAREGFDGLVSALVHTDPVLALVRAKAGRTVHGDLRGTLRTEAVDGVLALEARE